MQSKPECEGIYYNIFIFLIRHSGGGLSWIPACAGMTIVTESQWQSQKLLGQFGQLPHPGKFHRQPYRQ
jgi:hypothetical protein